MSDDYPVRKDPRFKKTQVTVDMYHTWVIDKDGMRKGFSRFKTFSTDAIGENDERLGTISGGTGAVCLTKDGKEWTIHHDDLWYAFVEALEKLDVD